MKEIQKKLMVVQQELKAPKSQYNEFNKFNYRNAEDILEAVKPILAAQGLTLVLSDEMQYIGQRYYIKATATLSDGEDEITATAYAREDESRAGMSESQVTGCSSSYARKYCLNGLFCIDDGKDSDSFNNKKEQPVNPSRRPVQATQAEIPPMDNLSLLRGFCKEKMAQEPEWKNDIKRFGTFYAEKLKNGWNGGFNITELYERWCSRRKAA